ncbi:hypothetical protein FGO68_gene4629 [Halteria grandinella]|uniref:Uncharacterized protein n=1 Tax=Halteria grandinella TaxID=5974 RepID=A0A8J8NAZ0_HALGN|nr:hypothetical protein FGO68_gene4629 [Halteria grandinella]
MIVSCCAGDKAISHAVGRPLCRSQRKSAVGFPLPVAGTATSAGATATQGRTELMHAETACLLRGSRRLQRGIFHGDPPPELTPPRPLAPSPNSLQRPYVIRSRAPSNGVLVSGKEGLHDDQTFCGGVSGRGARGFVGGHGFCRGCHGFVPDALAAGDGGKAGGRGGGLFQGSSGRRDRGARRAVRRPADDAALAGRPGRRADDRRHL